MKILTEHININWKTMKFLESNVLKNGWMTDIFLIEVLLLVQPPN